jgi:hypothetical protein
VLLDLNGRRRGRRPKGVSAPERVGRYFVGGVNPLIATNVPRAFPGKTLEESMNGAPEPSGDGRGPESRDGGFEEERPRRNPRRDSVDGVAAQEVSERRAQRFFDFEEDDRFDYTLKTPAEQKRKEAEDAVRAIATEAGRDAVVKAVLIEDGDKPKILVTIDEKGPASSLPPERRADNANDALFVMGNAALMSLNYLVNKIVNRYPDDRIRLAILPANDERLYLDALAEHQKIRATLPQVPGRRPRHDGRPPRPEHATPAAPPSNGAVEAAPAEAAPGFVVEAKPQVVSPVDVPVASTTAEPLVEQPAGGAGRAEGDVVPAPSEAEIEAKPKRSRSRAAEPKAESVAAERREADVAPKSAAEDDEDAPKAKRKPATKRATAKDEAEEKPKRPLKRAPRKAPEVEVVRAAPRKS